MDRVNLIYYTRSITNGVRFLRSAWLTGPFRDSDRHATQLYLTVGKEHGTGVGHRRRLPHSPSDRGFELATRFDLSSLIASFASMRTSDDHRRKDVGSELERNSSRSRSSRGYESQKHSERHPYGYSHDYRRHGNAVDEVPSSSSKQTKETHEKVNSETMNSSINDAESANDVNSTKVAAMKAAELVNKNLEGFGGVGYLSTDQKKKLLWGNKKKSASEESSSCWDFHLFPNQECQENFNRLMNLRLPLWLLPICPSGQIGQACESSSKETEVLHTDM
ncbi:hypothetical protein MUK42_16596 [Musa troglodytarum]|uniref:Arginine/serine-rich coiled-coil protein 2 n=1 Tax=Musa troglodytarum TaxID=320322 RepID=A0A9E7HDT8_9LILI|nr:hypothetical protein MUK42_16596 [Musa troglodytarum]